MRQIHHSPVISDSDFPATRPPQACSARTKVRPLYVPTAVQTLAALHDTPARKAPRKSGWILQVLPFQVSATPNPEGNDPTPVHPVAELQDKPESDVPGTVLWILHALPSQTSVRE